MGKIIAYILLFATGIGALYVIKVSFSVFVEFRNVWSLIFAIGILVALVFMIWCAILSRKPESAGDKVFYE